MAFKELTPREIELLTDEQRQTYEEELELYRQRVRFVEQLDRLEGKPIEPYQPKLKPIKPVSKVPEKKIGKMEHQVHQVVAVRKKAPNVDGIKLPVFSAPQLPQVAAQVAPRSVAVKKHENTPPELPIGVAVRIPQPNIKAAEPVKAELSTAPVIRIPAVSLKKAEPVKVNLDTVKKRTIKAYPNVNIDKEAIKPKLTAIPALKIPEAAVAVRPDVHSNLPKAPGAIAKVRVRHAAVPKMSALPEVPVAPQRDISYQKPDISKAVVQKAYVPAIPQMEYKKENPIRLNIPAAVRVRIKPKEYSALLVEKPAPVKPVRINPKLDWDFDQPEISFKPAAKSAPLSAPQVTYQKGDYRAQPLPDVAAVDLPEPEPQVDHIIQLLLREVKK